MPAADAEPPEPAASAWPDTQWGLPYLEPGPPASRPVPVVPPLPVTGAVPVVDEAPAGLAPWEETAPAPEATAAPRYATDQFQDFDTWGVAAPGSAASPWTEPSDTAVPAPADQAGTPDYWTAQIASIPAAPEPPAAPASALEEAGAMPSVAPPPAAGMRSVDPDGHITGIQPVVRDVPVKRAVVAPGTGTMPVVTAEGLAAAAAAAPPAPVYRLGGESPTSALLAGLDASGEDVAEVEPAPLVPDERAFDPAGLGDGDTGSIRVWTGSMDSVTAESAADAAPEDAPAPFDSPTQLLSVEPLPGIDGPGQAGDPFQGGFAEDSQPSPLPAAPAWEEPAPAELAAAPDGDAPEWAGPPEMLPDGTPPWMVGPDADRVLETDGIGTGKRALGYVLLALLLAAALAVGVWLGFHYLSGHGESLNPSGASVTSLVAAPVPYSQPCRPGGPAADTARPAAAPGPTL
jgi:hypothetical protein